MISWSPWVSAEVENDACPLPFSVTLLASVTGVEPVVSVKVTVPPEVTGFPPAVTVAVMVTDCPVVWGFWVEVTTVVVEVPVFSDSVMHQPEFRFTAPGATEYSAQAPSAGAPLKASPKVKMLVWA